MNFAEPDFTVLAKEHATKMEREQKIYLEQQQKVLQVRFGRDARDVACAVDDDVAGARFCQLMMILPSSHLLLSSILFLTSHPCAAAAGDARICASSRGGPADCTSTAPRVLALLQDEAACAC